MYYFMSIMVVAWITVIQLSVINNKNKGKDMYLGGVDKIRISPDWITDRITDRITESQKKNQKRLWVSNK